MLYKDFILSAIKYNFNYILVQNQQLTLKQNVKSFPKNCSIKDINIVTEVVFVCTVKFEQIYYLDLLFFIIDTIKNNQKK